MARGYEADSPGVEPVDLDAAEVADMAAEIIGETGLPPGEMEEIMLFLDAEAEEG